MPMFWGDYLADTSHLSTREHGAYLLLIAHYWLKSGLPSDEQQLARIARLSIAEWGEVRPTVASFFSADWKHARIDKELAKAVDASAAASAKARKAAEARYGRSLDLFEAPKDAPSTATSNAPSMPPSIAGASSEPATSQSLSPSHSKDISSLKIGDVNVTKGETEPRHGAISRDKKFLYFRADTPEFLAYAEDFREVHGKAPETNQWGGRWFSQLGEGPGFLTNPKKGAA